MQSLGDTLMGFGMDVTNKQAPDPPRLCLIVLIVMSDSLRLLARPLVLRGTFPFRRCARETPGGGVALF